MDRLLILGAGGFGKVVADIARQSGLYLEVAFLDDGTEGYKVLGKCKDYLEFADEGTAFYPAFGNNELRLQWIHQLRQDNLSVATLVHKKAYVSPTADIGEGVVVLPGAIVNTNTVVKTGSIINCNAVIDHDCVIEEGVHICLNATVKAENQIPQYTKIEAGMVVENRSYPLKREE